MQKKGIRLPGVSEVDGVRQTRLVFDPWIRDTFILIA